MTLHMLIATILAAQCSLPIQVTAIEIVAGKISVTPTDVKSLALCETQGGCHVFTTEALVRAMEAARALGSAQRVCSLREI